MPPPRVVQVNGRLIEANNPDVHQSYYRKAREISEMKRIDLALEAYETARAHLAWRLAQDLHQGKDPRTALAETLRHFGRLSFYVAEFFDAATERAKDAEELEADHAPIDRTRV